MSEITKKSEKIASAIYLITSFFNDHEPIKWKLRTLTTEFISLAVLLKDNFFRDRDVTLLKVRSLVWEIINLLSLTKNIGLVSITNYSLLYQELTKYLDLLGIPLGMSVQDDGAVLSVNFFEHEEDNSGISQNQTKPSLKDKHIYSVKGHLSTPNNTTGKYLSSNGSGLVSIKKNNRQNIIINMLKNKPEIMIKDISVVIRGCSEKTIQRELSDMVQKGVLKKIGDKRWSRYALI